MINQALHTLDLMQWICGFPQSVVAHTHNDSLQNVIEVEDTAVACFACADGVRFNLFATLSAATDFPIRLQVKLDSGDLLDVQNKQFSVNYVFLDSPQDTELAGKRVWGDGHKALVSDFYGCLEQNKPFSINYEEGKKVIQMILAMYASNGNRIEIEQ